MKLRVWVYNHLFAGIVDQLEFLADRCRELNWEITISGRPCDKSLIIVIENFQPNNYKIFEDYMKNNKKRALCIMTEHVDFLAGKQFYFHGLKVGVKGAQNDYMEPETQLERLRTLFNLSPFISDFITLGDLPNLNNFEEALPGRSVLRMGFPRVTLEDKEKKDVEPTYDFIFTGKITKYRSEILIALEAQGYKVLVNEELLSRKRRNQLVRKAKIVLNLPQRKDWSWLSLMRIYSALKLARSTISIGTNDLSEISACCRQISLEQALDKYTLKNCLVDWENEYKSACFKYNEMAKKFNLLHCDDERAVELYHDYFTNL
jgi:hypothetical protein